VLTIRGETPHQEAFRARVRLWFEENLPAGWGTEDYPQPADEKEWVQFLRGWQRKLYEGGWAGLAWPKEIGGQDATLTELAIFIEERDRAKAPPDLGISGTVGVGPMLVDHGTDEQKLRYLPPMLRGDEIWCQGFSEPDAGSDLASLTTRAVLDGETFVIDGQKVWTSRARWCDKMLLLVRTDPDAPKHRGLSALIVDVHAPGVVVSPIRQINGEDYEFAQVFLTGVRTPRENLVGRLNDGWAVALRTLMHERISATRAFEASQMFVDLLVGCRQQDADGERLLDEPTVRQDVGRLYAQVLGARRHLARTLDRVEQSGDAGGAENIGKLHVNELTQRIAELGSELLGPDLPVSPVQRLLGRPSDWSFDLMNTRRYTIGGGTSQIQRNIIGERMLGLARS
jgi:alkylation response protein AidB-like acyl-CoA dehydrogenase